MKTQDGSEQNKNDKPNKIKEFFVKIKDKINSGKKTDKKSVDAERDNNSAESGNARQPVQETSDDSEISGEISAQKQNGDLNGGAEEVLSESSKEERSDIFESQSKDNKDSSDGKKI